jgi:acetate kinase
MADTIRVLDAGSSSIEFSAFHPQANDEDGQRIGTPSSRAGLRVVPTDEEPTIARHTRDVIDAHRQGESQ